MTGAEKPHPISLEALFFTRSCVIAVPEHIATPDFISGPVNAINVELVPDQPGLYSATMRTTMNLEADKKQPYSIDMECVAFLRADNAQCLLRRYSRGGELDHVAPAVWTSATRLVGAARGKPAPIQ